MRSVLPPRESRVATVRERETRALGKDSGIELLPAAAAHVERVPGALLRGAERVAFVLPREARSVRYLLSPSKSSSASHFQHDSHRLSYALSTVDRLW